MTFTKTADTCLVKSNIRHSGITQTTGAYFIFVNAHRPDLFSFLHVKKHSKKQKLQAG
jgi:hypothetical protein